eukprot:GHVS01036343.1.p2 GENE.GHVS01036343.1~~GHVS01036343.1.p2  ORF type:complete len:109 (-),score=5.25 GHVS01036343.1:56-382(-)
MANFMLLPQESEVLTTFDSSLPPMLFTKRSSLDFHSLSFPLIQQFVYHFSLFNYIGRNSFTFITLYTTCHINITSLFPPPPPPSGSLHKFFSISSIDIRRQHIYKTST